MFLRFENEMVPRDSVFVLSYLEDYEKLYEAVQYQKVYDTLLAETLAQTVPARPARPAPQ